MDIDREFGSEFIEAFETAHRFTGGGGELAGIDAEPDPGFELDWTIPRWWLPRIPRRWRIAV